MQDAQRRILRERVEELASDPKYRPYVVGYLLSCLDERHWEALVQSALEFSERAEALGKELTGRTEGMR